MVADQLGGFLALAASSVTVAVHVFRQQARTGRHGPAHNWCSPPFVALLVGIVVGVDRRLAAGADGGVRKRVGATLAPLALFSIGMQFGLQLSRWGARGP